MGVHKILRVRVCAAHWVFGPKFCKQGSFFGRFTINMGELSRNWLKIAKNELFSAKIHHKSGHDSKYRYLEEGTFLKTGQQTPPSASHVPPAPGDFLACND